MHKLILSTGIAFFSVLGTAHAACRGPEFFDQELNCYALDNVNAPSEADFLFALTCDEQGVWVKPQRHPHYNFQGIPFLVNVQGRYTRGRLYDYGLMYASSTQSFGASLDPRVKLFTRNGQNLAGYTGDLGTAPGKPPIRIFCK